MNHPQYLGGGYRSTKPLPNWQMCLGMIPVFLIGAPIMMLWTICTTKRGATR